MSRTLPRILLVLIVLCTIGAAFGVWLFRSHPILLKTATGTARILPAAMPATISINGQVQPNALCVPINVGFDGKERDSLILWIPKEGAIFGRDVWIVDKRNSVIGLPNSSNEDYAIYFGRLFQSESGERYKPLDFTSPQPTDTQLKIEGNHIRFVISGILDNDRQQFEIVFN